MTKSERTTFREGATIRFRKGDEQQSVDIAEFPDCECHI